MSSDGHLGAFHFVGDFRNVFDQFDSFKVLLKVKGRTMEIKTLKYCSNLS